MIQKHEEDFNEIAYVVVNNNIKNDFVEQINKTLRLEFEKGEDDFSELIDHLQNDFKSEHPNLLVLDINETSDKTKNDEIINTIIKTKDILNGWKILILSREKVDTRNRIDTHNLNDNEDVEFLKELFLQKAGERYNDFDDFAELFKIVFYNPLLTEQLALYLHNDPEPATIEDIKKILYGASFKEEDMQGLAADRHDETIVSFLTNLIKYNDFNDNEKNLLRHFVLWQAEYIGYEVIKDLLKGVFASDDDLKNTLKSLSKRAILDTNNNQTLGYKLHGLLAESLREQIDVTKQDYETYFNNIIRIKDYNFRDFLLYADYIGNSLCEYEITTWVSFLNNTAAKFSQIWKTDYAKILYGKCIMISVTKLKTEPKNIKCLEALSSNYNNIAALQQDQLHDFKSAEINYNNAIDIEKKILQISNSFEHQNSLAMYYNNLALLQANHLNYPKSAETNFNNAIKIREKISQQSSDSEYLNDLANSYYNIALFQHTIIKNLDFAEQNYKKAIAIGEKLRNTSNTPEYLDQLVKSYNSFAFMQTQREDYELATQIYEKAIKINDIIKDSKIEYLVDWLVSKDNLADIKTITGNHNAAQDIVNEIIPIAEEILEDFPNFEELKMVYEDIKITESKLYQ